MNHIIRPGNIDDAPGIARVQVETWKHHYRGMIDDAYLDSLSVSEKVGKWEELIKRTDRWVILVALIDDEVVGFCHFSSTPRDTTPWVGEIHAIYIYPLHQWRGIGTALIEAATNALKVEWCNTIILWVLRANVASIWFYEHLGWEKDGESKIVSKWVNATLDEIRMKKTLT